MVWEHSLEHSLVLFARFGIQECLVTVHISTVCLTEAEKIMLQISQFSEKRI